MKKTHYLVLVLALLVLMCTSAFAKTHTTEIVPTDIIEYSLAEKDALSAELIIDEDGLYTVRITELSSEKFLPKISITILDGKTEIYRFEAEMRPVFDESEQVRQFEFATGLTAGEYIVKVENLTLFSDVSFKIETSFAQEESIETAKNNTFENATKALLNKKYHGGVVMADEIDYYSFEMPYDGYAFIQMYSPQLKFFSLYDENKNEIGSIGIEIEDADKVYELRTGLAKGRYFISVQPDENYTSPIYTLKAVAAESDIFEKEYNNTNEFATPILSGIEYQGNLFGIDDRDVYTFTLKEDSGIILDFTDTHVAKDGHYKIALSDGENVLFSSDECGRETSALNLGKGTYYFTVSSLGHKSFTSMAYKVKVTADNPLAICPPDENPGSDENEPMQENIVQFSDVNSNVWYADELLEARKAGLIVGLEGNTYNPKGNVTVAEALTMAVRVHSKKNGAQVDFSSSDGKWYEPYIRYATDEKLIDSDRFDNFERPATRAEVAYIFASLFENVQTNKNTIIPDVNENTPYCDSIHKLYSQGILKGNDENGTFYPERNLTRAEAAIILLRIHRL